MARRPKPMTEWTLKLSTRMLSKIRTNGFMHITVLGERNHGKTYYALKNMALTHYRLNNYTTREDEDNSWNYALDYLIFTIPQFKKIIKDNRKNRTKVPFILLDDAGSHFDSGLYHRSKALWQMLNICLDTIKDVTNCILVTCPFKKTLTSRLQEYDGFDIQLYLDRGFERYGTCINYWRLPTQHRRWAKNFEDHFSCWLPDEVHNRYLDMRNEFTLESIDELDRLEEKQKERDNYWGKKLKKLNQ